MCGEKTPGLSSYPIVPPHSLPRRSHFASLKRLEGCSSSTIANVSAVPVEVGKRSWEMMWELEKANVATTLNILFLAQFNNFVRITGLYWSYMLFL